ncbi:hypothetical protein PC129_g14527 [Phytophthora cactorum]|uniref:Uncharacterized protein n=1 Tax=Phytophthora cactorum TaxID=29920 RepID=A0A329SWS6_9STRA|nr:hypothetical protein Pcac1_g13865 [Phytophthora cactorum]KAG2810188.1 hypothetical protein PC112_g16168 [Phytophthora cactorum]KAG2811673.1 hypothetical protein PC111_g15147 [Phytophthora cactorum]KAG2851024.1 hypothetical protein PC113_g16263 [Phytophthora cactorum]KAG2889796.1 hypothetical protein PC114_g17783 [Phytophthora cactorum]
MEEVVGDAEFGSFPGERFRFSVGRVGGVGYIRLEHQVSKRSWTCEVTDVGAFAPEGVMLPPNTVLQYVATSLKESTGDKGPHLTRDDTDNTLQLEVLVKLDLAWAPKYVFPLKIKAQQAVSSSDPIKVLTTQVQELQQQVKTLKEQMKMVLRQTGSQQTPAASLPSPGFTIRRRPRHSSTQIPPLRRSTDTPSPPSHRERTWGDMLSINHTLAKVEEYKYREKRDSSGATERRHRRHACKVCSALRGDRRSTFQTSHYCVECTERRDGGMVFLCDKVRPHGASEYQNATCNQIWHALWGNGEKMSETGVSSIRMRKKLRTG